MDDLLKKGYEFYKSGDLVSARKHFRAAIELDSNNALAWWALSFVMENDVEVLTCLDKAISLDPSNEKAKAKREVIKEKIRSASMELSGEDFIDHSNKSTDFHDLRNTTSKKTSPKDNIKNIKESARKIFGFSEHELKIIISILVTIVVLFIFGIASIVSMQVKENNALATKQAQSATYMANLSITATQREQCKVTFRGEMLRLLSDFFRQENIAETTSRINLPEQISRLEDIRKEAWNLPSKDCESKLHGYLMNYMDKSIESYIAFSGDRSDLTVNSLYLESVMALIKLDDEIVARGSNGGLVSLFRSAGYYYWEKLDDPNWKIGGNS